MAEIIKKLTTLAHAKSIDAEAHTVDFVINSGGVDLVHEELNPMGCDFADFMRNPVVLWAHDDWSPPIAKALDVRLDPDDGVLSLAKFAVEEDPFAARVFKLYEGGYLNAASVRFIPTETIHYDEDSDERKERGVRVRYEKWKLLEYSPVPIPCDPAALALGLEHLERDPRMRGAMELARAKFLETEDDALALARLVLKKLEREGTLTGLDLPQGGAAEPAAGPDLSPEPEERGALLDPELDTALAEVLKMARAHLWTPNR